MSEEKQLTQDYTSDKTYWPMWLLSFFVPVVGYIFYMVWQNKKPRYSKSSGWGAIFGCFFYLILIIALILVNAAQNK